VRTNFQPPFANSFAVASPIPLLAPVIIAVLIFVIKIYFERQFTKILSLTQQKKTPA
jgi:hypothetical protein